MLIVRGLLPIISNIIGDSRLINLPLACLTETQLLFTIVLRNVSTIYEIIRSDEQFESLAVNYNKHNFKCSEQENIDAVIYIKFSTSFCNLSHLSESPVKISMQSLGCSELVSKATHIEGDCLDHIYLRNTDNKFSFFEVKMNSVYYSDHDPVPFYLTDHQYTNFAFITFVLFPN